MTMSKEQKSVLALYPNRYGLGYALFGSPDDLIDCGIGYIRPTSNRKTMKRVRQYLDFYKPSVVVTRGNEPVIKRLSLRLERLVKLIEKEAQSQKLKVHSYHRGHIQNVFTQFGANTKYHVSQKLISWYPQLKKYGFPKRKRWMNESHNTGVFDAVSLAMVFYYLE